MKQKGESARNRNGKGNVHFCLIFCERCVCASMKRIYYINKIIIIYLLNNVV